MTVRGIVPHNVAQGVSIRAVSRYQEPVTIPTYEEIVALLGAADSLANSKNAQIARTWQRYRPILYLAVDSGMRPQEYLAIGTSAIDDCGVHVRRAIDGGNRSLSVPKTPAGRRFIELSPETIDMVRHFAEHYAIQNEYDLVFPANNGKWLCRKNWQRRGFNVACEQAGLVEILSDGGDNVARPKFRPYDLRHFFASMLIDKETNLKKIQTLMGHTNIETTLNVYGHLIEKKQNEKGRSHGLLSEIRRNSCGESVANLF